MSRPRSAHFTMEGDIAESLAGQLKNEVFADLDGLTGNKAIVWDGGVLKRMDLVSAACPWLRFSD